MRSFNEIYYPDFRDRRLASLLTEIKSKGKDYILQVDEAAFTEYLYQKYLLEPLQVQQETEQIGAPVVTREAVYSWRREQDVYTFRVQYAYSGSGQLFNVRPTKWIPRSYDIEVDINNNMVSFFFKVYKQDPKEFYNARHKAFKKAFCNIGDLNTNVAQFNKKLQQYISEYFLTEKRKYLNENNFFEAINLPVHADISTVFSTPMIARRAIPQPTIARGKQFSSEPMMSQEMYEDVLKVVYASGKSMEKKPALYLGKDEEGLRDQFLFVLETRYEGTTATGETFNRSGKTDILLKYSGDGSNLFVAECKWWNGAKEFLAGVSQLFDNYLTWRDSKTALLLFVRNRDFSAVLNSFRKEIKTHPYFSHEAGARGQSSFSYIFRLPQDNQKQVYLEVIAFHYDQQLNT
jgi:hypothetical protein